MAPENSLLQDVGMSRLRWWLVGSVLVVNLIGVTLTILRIAFAHDNVLGLSRKFDPRFEANVPTWLSTILLFACAQVLFLIWCRVRENKGAFAINWLILSAGFAFLSLDEAAEVHEMLIALIPDQIAGIALPPHTWVVFGAAGATVLAFSFWRFLGHLEPRIRLNFVVAGVIYLGGALGMEALGGVWLATHHNQDAVYMALATVEETMEMLGAAIFVGLALEYFAALASSAAANASVLVADGVPSSSRVGARDQPPRARIDGYRLHVAKAPPSR